jgi:hypothetical protein
MTTLTVCRSLGRVGSKYVAAIVLGAVLLTVHPARAQQGEHWVGTWATAGVGRPQNPPPGQTAPPSPTPFMHFDNQTLRQIVHTSIGGRRVRVVLSNAAKPSVKR